MFLLCFILCFKAIFKHKTPGAYIRKDDLTEGFYVKSLGGLYLEGRIFGILYGILSSYPQVFKGWIVLSNG